MKSIAGLTVQYTSQKEHNMLRIHYKAFIDLVTLPFYAILWALLKIHNYRHRKAIDAIIERQKKWEAYKATHNIIDPA